MKRRIVLASTSPRRKEILEAASVEFSVEAPGIEEDMDRKLPPRELVKALALEKAGAVAPRHDNAFVLAADTVVALGKRVWSKPANEKEARAMIAALSGKTHDVWTGFCIIDTATGRRVLRAKKASVRFRALSRSDIERHLSLGHWRGFAGSYSLQAAYGLTERVEGDLNTVIGLPISAVLKELRRLGAGS